CVRAEFRIECCLALEPATPRNERSTRVARVARSCASGESEPPRAPNYPVRTRDLASSRIDSVVSAKSFDRLFRLGDQFANGVGEIVVAQIAVANHALGVDHVDRRP